MEKPEELNELKKIQDRFDKILTATTNLVDMIEDTNLEPYLDEYEEKLLSQEKLPKKQREKLALEFLAKKCPKFVAEMKEIDLLLQGIALSFNDKVEALEEIQCKISEIEELKSEVEQELQDI